MRYSLPHIRLQILACSLVLACGLTGCFRKDQRTITVSVPQMRSEDCSRLVQEALSKTEGVQSAKPDIVNGQVEVTYNGLILGIKNVEYAIANAGFDANEIKAPVDVREKLPESCR